MRAAEGRESEHADGYAARDALTHPQLRRAMTAGQRHALTRLVRAAGLDAGTIAAPLRSDLMRAVTSAQDQLRRCLQHGAVTSPATPAPGRPVSGLP
ncbi:hypothetical protein [Streptomyces sp. NPDC052042]|uniref:hypothetical protein n=1 Tax=Streptomyces sp. NPDC052042 TaxID=3365683 RepID=UPI0037CD5142